MTRYKLILEYDGGPFVGWQRQENGLAVQAALEEAIFRFCQERVEVVGAGRTDAGVHAAGQVAHFDLAKPAEASQVRDALNFHLRPLPVAVLDAAIVADDFHARFSARRRRYLYRIVNRHAPLALARGFAWHIAQPLDHAAMHQAAQTLVGHHDFTSFRASICQAKSPEKTLDRLDVERRGSGTGDGEILLHAEARSFLHNQVRIMVGSLVMVGEGKWSQQDLAEALAARDRRAGGPTAPALGLCLMGVDY